MLLIASSVFDQVLSNSLATCMSLLIIAIQRQNMAKLAFSERPGWSERGLEFVVF
jgi:hypothetical protein